MNKREYRGFAYSVSQIGSNLWRWNCSSGDSRCDGLAVGDETAADNACRATIDRLTASDAQSPRLAGE